MKNKLILHIIFLVPFVITVLNAQVLITYFVSESLAKAIAYGNVGLVLIGTAFLIKDKGPASKTASLWIIYYLIYFSIGILASAKHYEQTSIMLSTIPFIYTIGFYYYLSHEEHRKIFGYVAIVAFLASCIICIYWNSINFDLDRRSVNIYADRAQGVYGDANNMALATIICFVLIFKLFNPKQRLFKILKIVMLGTAAYSLLITFSNTGFMAFVVSLVILNFKYLKGLRLLFGMLLLPLVYILLLNLNTLTAHLDLVGQQRAKINNIVNIVSFNFDKVDDSGRSELQEKLKPYIYENPIVGNGIDFGISFQAHNTYMIVWADAGIFALIFFLFMLGTYFLRALWSPPETRFFVLPILLALYVFMLSLHSVINQPYIMALFIFLGYVIDINTTLAKSSDIVTEN